MTEQNKNNTPIANESSAQDVSLNNTVNETYLAESKPETDNSPLPPGHNEVKTENFGLEILKIVVLAIIIVTPIRIFIAQPFIVEGASMNNTFASGEYLIVDQLSYRFKAPDRGDVIIFRFPLEPSKFFIKRVIGLPNDKVVLQGKSTIIINEENPDGLVVNESYLSPENINNNSLSVTLSEGEYFVMGDNRKESSDSRSWGTLNRENIMGRAFIRLFPITSFDVFPGK